ncbi:hypothetical protein PO909_030419 [Leuciscus waleckii]
MGEATHELHVFSDASEQAYGAVAYLRTIDQEGRTYLSFIIARSCVTSKRAHSIPRLDLCGSLVAAQLAKLLENELTPRIKSISLWTDSTTVLQWLNLESCRFRVFVGNRIAEIQELTDKCSWHYVSSADNPADDLTKGKSLQYLAAPNRWSQGPSFLLQDPKEWPVIPKTETMADKVDLWISAFCGISTFPPSSGNTDGWNYHTWQELLDVTAQELQTTLSPGTSPQAEDYHQAELHILKRVQQESFPEDYKLLGSGKSVRSKSRLITLAPEMDPSSSLIRVGRRLRRVAGIEDSVLHPLVLDPNHPVTRLIIHHYDHKLHHSGIDCFGPLLVKIGRRTEKRWGILFKCLTTRAVHLDLLSSMSTDSFLMALRRFVSRRGTPPELWSDQGTNYRRGVRELREAYAALVPDIQSQFARQRIHFHFNPPSTTHFGGVWEREVRSVKSALYTVLGSQSVIYPESEMLSRRHWRHSQVLADRFWSRFIRDYLPSLQTRQKWQASPPDLKEKTFVLVVDRVGIM